MIYFHKIGKNLLLNVKNVLHVTRHANYIKIHLANTTIYQQHCILIHENTQEYKDAVDYFKFEEKNDNNGPNVEIGNTFINNKWW